MHEIIRSNYPLIESLAIEKGVDSLNTSWGDKRNQYKIKCEELLARTLDRKYCLMLSHGTGALIVALKALGIKKDTKVGVPSLTWVSCASSIIIAGGIPVFIDVDPNSFCIDQKALNQIKENNIKYVIGVNLLGNLISDEIIIELRNLNVKIIEDSAESLGASLKNGQKSGSLGDISCLSFHATKIITAGQGGAVLTDDHKLFERLKSLSHHGINTKISGKYYWSNELGYNFSISDFQCALISAQIPFLKKRADHLRSIYSNYESRILNEHKYKFLSLMPKLHNQNQVFWLPLTTFNEKIYKKDKESLNSLREKMVKSGETFGVEIRPCFYPLHKMPTFEKYYNINPTNLNFTEDISYSHFALPSGAGFKLEMTEIALERIFSCFNQLK